MNARRDWFDEMLDRLRQELGEEPCPRPCNHRPDAFPMRQCREAGECGCSADGSTPHYDAQLATLMDIRDELKLLNSTLRCPNFLEVPSILRQIRRNTAKPRKPRAVGKPKLRVVTR